MYNEGLPAFRSHLPILPSHGPTMRTPAQHIARLVALICTTVVFSCSQVCFAGTVVSTQLNSFLSDKCLHCHDAETRNGGVNIEKLLESSTADSKTDDIDLWVKIDRALERKKMPPVDEEQPSSEELDAFQGWFHEQFIMPAGRQHPGPYLPRRLTREELQNTLEDLLHVDIRRCYQQSSTRDP